MKVCRGTRVTEGLENAWVGKASTTSISCSCQRKGLGLIWLQSRKFKYSLQGTFLSKDCSCLAHKGIMRVWKLEFSNQFSLHRSLWLTRAQILLCRAVPRADRLFYVLVASSDVPGMSLCPSQGHWQHLLRYLLRRDSTDWPQATQEAPKPCVCSNASSRRSYCSNCMCCINAQSPDDMAKMDLAYKSNIVFIKKCCKKSNTPWPHFSKIKSAKNELIFPYYFWKSIHNWLNPACHWA